MVEEAIDFGKALEISFLYAKRSANLSADPLAKDGVLCQTLLINKDVVPFALA